MFDRDKWQEILGTIRKNKLRTFLTAFSVAWGIFVLIILLGCGKALRNSAEDSFRRDAMRSFDIGEGQTTIAYNGFKPGRQIHLTNEDYEMIHNKVADMEYTSAIYDGNVRQRVLSYKNLHGGFVVRSCIPDHQKLENCDIIKGRFINKIDQEESRKACVIGIPVQTVLFPKEDPIDKFIDIDGIPFKVVGIFKDPAAWDNDRLYIPLSTSQKAFNGKNYINHIWTSIKANSKYSSDEIVQQARSVLAAKYHFSPNDMNAIHVANWSKEFENVMSLFSGIELFTWIIGIFTLIAGVVGVSNIMMIIVKERTKEIGIRKAIGASPVSIVMLIVQEAIFITSFAGYIGLMLGVGVLELLNVFNIEGEFFHRPEVDLRVAVSATVLIIIAGALAGLFPAIRAAKVEPIEALRTE
ncbi:MAG TPA: ABC transporter permease [Bacteroidia bacterium]|jgi:putative ABC transport system permease protein|nr:ABC transporter permease [Bacteroidia bacterium]